MARARNLPVPSGGPVAARVTSAILNFVSDIPPTRERKRSDPESAARARANSAAAKAAMAAGSLALPPGPLGWLTILPEMIAVWKIQSQMVSDIAALYGKKASLTREQMIYCLFRHTAAQAVRDLAVRTGERVLVRRASLDAVQNIVERVGVRITHKALGKGISRWLPLVGAGFVGAYAYYDTTQVAQTAIELFEREIDIDPEPIDA